MPMRISGLMSGMDTETIISQLVEAKSVNLNKTKKAQLSLKYKQDAWKSLNTQIISLYSKTLSNLRFESSFVKKTSKVSNSSVVSVITGDGAMNSVQSLEVKQLAKSGYLTGSKLYRADASNKEAITGSTTLGELGVNGYGRNIYLDVKGGGSEAKESYIEVNENTTIDGVVSQLRNAGLNANFDVANGRFYISSKISGAENDFSITAEDGDSRGVDLMRALGINYYDDDASFNAEKATAMFDENRRKDILGALEKLDSAAAKSIADKLRNMSIIGGSGLKEEWLNDNLTADEMKLLDQAAKSVLPVKSKGEDAVITLNGAEYTSNSNTFAINGLTLNVTATTAPGESVTITTEDDTDGIYDMIKNFFKEYNTLINQMDKLYNADSAKEYEPLLSSEKEAMTDSEIEEWETKVKDSILRKDSTLGTFSYELKKIMMEGISVNGKDMYLTNFGINTLGYFVAPENEKNAYHIDGDSDDTETSGNTDKLKSMIANDPDTVVSFFTQLSKKLYDRMTELTGTSEYSSFNSAYDDKKMQTEYDNYTTKIKELEDKLADYEDKWYSKFAAMETALSKMQQNASAVTALLGGSSY